MGNGDAKWWCLPSHSPNTVGSGVRRVWGTSGWPSLPTEWIVISNLKNREIRGLGNRGRHYRKSGLVSNGKPDPGGRNIKEKRFIYTFPYHYTFLMDDLFILQSKGAFSPRDWIYSAPLDVCIKPFMLIAFRPGPRPSKMLAGIWSEESIHISSAVNIPTIILALWMKEQNLILTHGPWTLTHRGEEISKSIVRWLNTL